MTFEAKLKDWRRALHQAYRNTAFATTSYVLLPKEVAECAINFEEEFISRSVGLCYIDGQEVVIAIHAQLNEPVQPWLTVAALGCVGQEYKCRKQHSRRSREPIATRRALPFTNASAKALSRKRFL